MKARTAVQWAAILRSCGVAPNTAKAWGPVFEDEIHEGTFSKGDADLVDWLPEILHESGGLERMVESLNYKATVLVPLFGAHRITEAQAQAYGRIEGKQYANERAIANTVYGGAWGLKHLGNTLPEDGWTYRGRSPIQITGRDNYRRIGDLIGQDLLGVPDLLAHPRFALEACIAWWEDKIPDSMLGETTSIRRRVNGGAMGLEEVKRLTKLAKVALS